jgi:hypothetical protein
VPLEQQTPWAKENLDVVVKYYLSILRYVWLLSNFAILDDQFVFAATSR